MYLTEQFISVYFYISAILQLIKKAGVQMQVIFQHKSTRLKYQSFSAPTLT